MDVLPASSQESKHKEQELLNLRKDLEDLILVFNSDLIIRDLGKLRVDFEALNACMFIIVQHEELLEGEDLGTSSAKVLALLKDIRNESDAHTRKLQALGALANKNLSLELYSLSIEGLKKYLFDDPLLTEEERDERAKSVHAALKSSRMVEVIQRIGGDTVSQDSSTSQIRTEDDNYELTIMRLSVLKERVRFLAQLSPNHLDVRDRVIPIRRIIVTIATEWKGILEGGIVQHIKDTSGLNLSDTVRLLEGVLREY